MCLSNEDAFFCLGNGPENRDYRGFFVIKEGIFLKKNDLTFLDV
jgi:hypothetical protein